jgi:ArsR family transcriptional regulator, arsenate/arsenite/antimonite-responsive transcriptional repressor
LRGSWSALLGQGSNDFDATSATVADFSRGINFFRYDVGMSTPLPVLQCCAPLDSPQLSEDEADELERIFKALADRHRVKILNRLLSAGGEAVCVCEFQDTLGLKQSSVSYHLKQLLDAGIVRREKRGSFAYFSLTEGALEHVRSLLSPPAVAAA